MKRLALALLLAASSLPAQTRVLVGANLGVDFGNRSIGGLAGIEQPFAKRFEVNLYDIASPIESHVALGSGWANAAKGGGIFWFTPSERVGYQTEIEQSQYHVTDAGKAAYYLTTGPVIRFHVQDSPSRLFLAYARQVHNGISSDGTESSRLQGVTANWDIQVSCNSYSCFRIQEVLDVGHILRQSNPLCDGTYGITGGPNNGPCYRLGAWSGGFSASFIISFHGKGDF